jgi:hypothetical protein
MILSNNGEIMKQFDGERKMVKLRENGGLKI